MRYPGVRDQTEHLKGWTPGRSLPSTLVFASVAVLGLLAAKRPELLVRYFLAERQRERLTGNMHAVSWTGWIIFGGGVFTLVAMLFESTIHREVL